MSFLFDKIRENLDVLSKILPIISITIPLLILYLGQYFAFPPYPQYYNPNANSFEIAWKGRIFYIFFLWIALMELVLGWEKLNVRKMERHSKMRVVTLALVFSLPTIYVVVANFYGVNRAIVDWTYSIGINPGCDFMPLSVEHMVLSMLFTAMILSTYGTGGLRTSPISPVFLATIGILYTIDNVYPEGSFTPFQILVPVTSLVAASVLNLMGYQTQWLGESGGMPILRASNSVISATFKIAWACSGIESLILYTLVIALFFKAAGISWKNGTIYFLIGAAVTFFINVLRIAAIFVIAINTGNEGSIEVRQFHNIYGQLFSIIWITVYPMLIIGGRNLWRKRMGRPEKQVVNSEFS
jgi:thaumarchaeosortase